MKMNVLAIDTTTDICSISLAVNNKIIDSNDKIIESSQTKYLAKNIDSLIKKNTFQHGGISMDEMIVPLISLNKK